MKVLTNITAPSQKFEGEKNSGKSETIPGQEISPQELLRRYATGQPLGLKQVEAVYDDDPNFDVPEFYKMDKLDRLHYLQENTARTIEKREELKQFIEENEQKQQAKRKELEEQAKQNETSAKERSDAKRGNTNEPAQ